MLVLCCYPFNKNKNDLFCIVLTSIGVKIYNLGSVGAAVSCFPKAIMCCRVIFEKSFIRSGKGHTRRVLLGCPK